MENQSLLPETKKQLNDFDLCCEIILVFYRYRDSQNLTVDEIFDDLSKYYIIDKEVLKATLERMYWNGLLFKEEHHIKKVLIRSSYSSFTTRINPKSLNKA